MYQTDLHEICRTGRTLAVDERAEVIFFRSLKDVAVATTFVKKLVLHLLVRMTFARAAPPAYDKNGN